MLADPQVSPGGAALVWVFDFSESENELARLREAAARAQGDFAALVGLIEAAPMPMWFRGADLRSEEHTSELQSLMRISYAVFCLKQKHDEHRYDDGRSPKQT